ncbi:RH17 [Symbiodinium microadriaticum]|nr:RH17 [Symbiodinium microadriaticum]
MEVCNGFGPAGHLVSFRVAQSLPKFLFEASTEEVPEQLVARAFHAAAAELSPFAGAASACQGGSFLVSGDGGSDPTGEDSDTASNTAGLGSLEPDFPREAPGTARDTDYSSKDCGRQLRLWLWLWMASCLHTSGH